AIPIILSGWTNHLTDSNPLVREYAAESIRYADHQIDAVVPVLLKLLEDPSHEVREKAADSFRHVSHISNWTNQFPRLEAQLYNAEWGPYLTPRAKGVPTDSEIRQKLPGTWSREQQLADGNRESGSMKISVDGTFQSHWTRTGPKG